MKLLPHHILTLAFMTAGAAMADTLPYTQAAFDKLQHERKPILVGVHADWCPTCRAQAPILESLLKRNDFQGVTSFRVDFDKQKDVLHFFHVSKQSTLIVFKGGKEVGRSLGDTSRDGIEALLRKAQ